MKCNYPNCRTQAQYTPVLSIPTIRTVGLIVPVFSQLAKDAAVMARAQFDFNIYVRQYQEAVEEYKRNCNTLVKTDKPTYLVGQPICRVHKATYNVKDWFGVSAWRHLHEAAQDKGVVLDTKNVMLTWECVGWVPTQTLEIER